MKHFKVNETDFNNLGWATPISRNVQTDSSDFGAAMYADQERRRKAGSFGYGDFGLREEGVYLGSAIADKIVEEANQTWTEAELQNAKAKWREMGLAWEQALRDRKASIDWIKVLPAGAEKNEVIARFNEAESSTMNVYATIQPIVANIFGNVSALPVLEQATFGFLPAIPVAGYVALIASLAIVGGVITALYAVSQHYNSVTEDAKAKYELMKTNPVLAAKLPAPPSSSFFDQLGAGSKTGMIMIAGTVAVFIALKMFRK